MPEITHIPQSVANNIISQKEYVAALTRGEFTQTDYLFKINGKAFIESPLYKELSWIIDLYSDDRDDENEFDYEDYLVIMNARIEGLPEIWENFHTHCIFYKCVLPPLSIHENSAFDLFFIGTHIESITANWASCWGIYLDDNSVCGNISFLANSKCSKLKVSRDSQCAAIQILGESKCDEIGIENNSQSGDISIEDGSGNEHLEVYSNSKCGLISVTNNSKCSRITVGEKSECLNIRVSTGSEAKQITAYDNCNIGRVFITDKCSIEDISISNSRCTDISIQQSSCGKHIDIVEKSVFSEISIFSNSQCNQITIESECIGDYIAIADNSNCNRIEILNSRVGEVILYQNTGSLDMHNAHIPLMRLNDCFLHNLAWEAGTKGEIYIVGGAINHLNLSQTALLKDAVFSLIDVQIYVAQLQELLVQGQLIFRNIRPIQVPFYWQPAILQHFKIEKLNKEAGNKSRCLIEAGIKQLEDLEKEYKKNVERLCNEFESEELPLFRIVDSSLGKTEITGSDLENFHFEYRDSKLLETFFSGTKLPKDKIKIYHKDAEDSLHPMAYFEQKVSIYNQLKRIYDNQGDIVEATWYHSKAMDNQERLLKEKYKQDGDHWFGEQGFDLFTFRLNKYTNNHGESWRNALRFILLISLGMYCLYYLSLHYKETPSLQATDRFVRNYFQFLDPTHKIDFLVGKKPLWWLPVFIDFLGRILIGYGIYQFISAFRRHGRR